VGAAWSWVASDALELHASLRHLARHDTWQDASASAGALASASPWRALTAGAAQQLLLGGTWTSERQVSVLLEAWHDGTAPSRGQWKRWANRNAALQHLGAVGAPRPCGGGQPGLANPGFQRQPLPCTARTCSPAWPGPQAPGKARSTCSTTPQTVAACSPPAWPGRAIACALEGGLRASAGPGTAVVRQLPVQRQAFVQAVWVLD
jgi:hypothetical protein